jgi:MFS transporter, OFA family, oxalate/formate antiporter
VRADQRLSPVRRYTLPADWPFDVRRSPFFYGWVIWLLSTLGFLMSVPGQTTGMAVFTDPFMAAFGLSRTQLSTAYFFGTLCSSLFLTRAGRWYDRHQARTLMCGSSLLLGLVLLLISGIDGVVAMLPPQLAATAAFVLILSGYFGVRFAGQGVLTSVSRNVLLMWFDRRRGLVSGFRGVFVSLGFSLAPLILALMIDQWGWRGALWVMAGAVGVVFTLLCLVAVRDTPESCGLLPDGVDAAEHLRNPPPAAAPDQTVDQARRSAVFWMYASALSMHALFGTAVTFHIVDIFEAAGRTRVEAFAYFLPQAVVSLTVNLIASALADRMALKPLLVLMLAGFVLGAFGLLALQSTAGYWLLVAGFGLGGGLWGVLSNLGYVRNFGRLHLGEITGLSTALTVFASATGPLLFSLGVDWFASYAAAVSICLIMNLGLLVAAVVIRHNEPALRVW